MILYGLLIWVSEVEASKQVKAFPFVCCGKIRAQSGLFVTSKEPLGQEKMAQMDLLSTLDLENHVVRDLKVYSKYGVFEDF